MHASYTWRKVFFHKSSVLLSMAERDRGDISECSSLTSDTHCHILPTDPLHYGEEGGYFGEPKNAFGTFRFGVSLGPRLRDAMRNRPG